MEGKVMRKMPIGIQYFEKLIKDGYIYVDKTEKIYQMVVQGGYYFLSRPRRFGKSLLISTLEALFLGKREVFKGLAIDSKPDIDWAVHPVLRLDLNAENYNVKESLDVQLDVFWGNAEKQYGRDGKETTFGSRFTGVIRRAYEKTGRRVVILVDEYDKPMLQAIGNPELQDAYRSTLKGFVNFLIPFYIEPKTDGVQAERHRTAGTGPDFRQELHTSLRTGRPADNPSRHQLRQEYKKYR